MNKIAEEIQKRRFRNHNTKKAFVECQATPDGNHCKECLSEKTRLVDDGAGNVCCECREEIT